VTLESVKATKTALGCTLNDVVMAVCAGGLRSYLQGRGVLPDEPLVGMVPVSIRTGDEEDRWTNRVSGLTAALPTNEADPLERVRKVHESMMMAKGLHDALPAEALTEFADFPPPAVFTRASRMATRFQTGNRFGSPVNLVISNVPGPREPLYAAGAKLVHYVPVSTIAEGQGLNITVQSYLDTLDFGLVGCAELVPDIWDLADAIVDDLQALATAAGVQVETRMAAD
jgi:diacylglycerol O-acyltransferase